MRLSVPWGIFGYGNIGDEAMLKGFRHLVDGYPRKLDVQIASQNPGHATAVEPGFRYYKQNGISFRKWWAARRSRAQLIVGDTPIADRLGRWPLEELAHLAEDASRKKQPLAFLGTGTETLEHQVSEKLVRERLAPRVVHWSVRSERDKERLLRYGIEATRVNVAADLAWLLEPAEKEFAKTEFEKKGIRGRGPTIGVNLIDEPYSRREVPELSKRVAEVLDFLVKEHEARIVFFCNDVREAEGFDKAANQNVRIQMRHGEGTHAVENRYWSPAQMMSMIGVCDYTMSMRYHFCLFSAVQGVPFLAMQRSDKVQDLCTQIDWQNGVRLKDFAVPLVAKLFSEMQRNKSELTESLNQQTAKMREQAKLNVRALDVVCACAGG